MFYILQNVKHLLSGVNPFSNFFKIFSKCFPITINPAFFSNGGALSQVHVVMCYHEICGGLEAFGQFCMLLNSQVALVLGWVGRKPDAA